MNLVETLRAAADRLDELAAKATPGPWSRQPRRNSPQIAAEIPDGEQGRWIDGTQPDGSRELVTVVSVPTWSGHQGFVRERSGRDLDYVAVMGPQVAPALSAWLRAEADTAQASDQTRANFRPSWRDDWSPEDPPPDWSETNRVAALEAMHRHPLAFARMVLGGPAGDAS